MYVSNSNAVYLKTVFNCYGVRTYTLAAGCICCPKREVEEGAKMDKEGPDAG